MPLDKRARELLRDQFNDEGKALFDKGAAVVITTASALNAIKAALQPPEGYMLVPLEPPYRPKYIATGTLVEGKKRTPVYLTWTDEGGGWYQWCTSKSWANLFSSEKSAMRNAEECPGPNFLMPSPGTITIEKVHGPKALAYLDMLSHVRTKEATP